MLHQSQVVEVRRLATEGHPQRAIAKKVGVSRMSVHKILNGQRTDYGQPESDDGELDVFQGPIGRCPMCGARVHLPCFACRVAQDKEIKQAVSNYQMLPRQRRRTLFPPPTKAAA